LKQSATKLFIVIAVLVLASCGKPENTATKSESDQSSPAQNSNAVSVTAQDINPHERSSLKGGTLTLSVKDFAENWNPLHVDGNQADYQTILESMLPMFFDFDEAGVPTPNPMESMQWGG